MINTSEVFICCGETVFTGTLLEFFNCYLTKDLKGHRAQENFALVEVFLEEGYALFWKDTEDDDAEIAVNINLLLSTGE